MRVTASASASAIGIVEIRRLASGGYGEQPLFGLTGLFGMFYAAVDAEAAADATADRRAAIAAFEEFIGYAEFTARAKKYGLT